MKTMKRLMVMVRVAAWAMLVLIVGCTDKPDFARFLIGEIGSLGGNTNGLSSAGQVQGRWTIRRDRFGAAINTDGIRFDTITNLLTVAYGEPLFYSAANARHGQTYIYHPTNAGISIFVSSTRTGAEITLTKPPAL